MILHLADRFLFLWPDLFFAPDCFAAICFLFSIEIEQGDDRAVDLVLGCAVRHSIIFCRQMPQQFPGSFESTGRPANTDDWAPQVFVGSMGARCLPSSL